MKYFIILLILIGVYAAVKFLMECAKDVNVNIKSTETNIPDIPVKEPECWHPPIIKNSETSADDTHKRVA